MSGIPAGPFGLTVLATAAALLVTMAVTFAVALRVGKHSVADTAWGLGIALVLDNYATHKTPGIHQWLLKHPHFHLHSTPASSSWLNLVDRWFRRADQPQAPPVSAPQRHRTRGRHPQVDQRVDQESPVVRLDQVC